QDQNKNKALNILEEELSTIKKELGELKTELKNIVSMNEPELFKQLFKTQTRVLNKQTGVEGVQTPVQTPVQTGDLSNFSIMERAILYILLNSDLKLSYDDLAAMTGKSRATIRGQINAIKRKSEGLIMEQIEKNGKKRVFIPDEVRDKLLKNVKVRVKSGKKLKNNKD
ncbi:MAG: HTH domain-containing protein, partial [Candidatus Pacearchaeota archaeon]